MWLNGFQADKRMTSVPFNLNPVPIFPTLSLILISFYNCITMQQ